VRNWADWPDRKKQRASSIAEPSRFYRVEFIHENGGGPGVRLRESGTNCSASFLMAMACYRAFIERRFLSQFPAASLPAPLANFRTNHCSAEVWVKLGGPGEMAKTSMPDLTRRGSSSSTRTAVAPACGYESGTRRRVSLLRFGHLPKGTNYQPNADRSREMIGFTA
jgi:hypothetical protein